MNRQRVAILLEELHVELATADESVDATLPLSCVRRWTISKRR